MARDESSARYYRVIGTVLLDGTRPAAALDWVSPVTPGVAQAAVGAGHWAAGRRRRAVAAWVSAAGIGLVAWGLGTEAPARAEVDGIWQQQRELLRRLGKVPDTAGALTPTTRDRSRWTRYDAGISVGAMVFHVRHGLRRPRRLTALAIADEAPMAAFWALRAARAVQRRRPLMAAGSALVVAGSVARLRAASAEPLR